MSGMRIRMWGIVGLSVVLAGCGAAGPPDVAMSAPDNSAPVAAAPPESGGTSDDAVELSMTDAPAADGFDEEIGAVEAADTSETAMAVADETPVHSPGPAAPRASSFAPRSQSLPSNGAKAYTTRTVTPNLTAATQNDGIRARPAGSSISRVDEIVDQLEYGTVGFYTPSELPFGETFVQEVVLSPSESEAVLRSAMSNPAAPAEFVSLQVAPRMEATLTGRGFEIEALSEPVQIVTSHRPTKWRFNVTPIEHGRQQLHLSLLAHLDIDGRDAPLIVETKDAVIEVDITVGQRLAGVVSQHWQWIWAAVIVPAIGFVWRRKTGRRPPAQRSYSAKAA